MNTSYKYVIIGNSAAAVGCVEGIRRIDGSGTILIISDESHHVYGRPLISYLLQGRTDLERMKYRPSDWYEKNAVQTLLGVSVTGVDAEAHTVSTSSGEVIKYEKLLAAAGSSPFVPPMTGLENIGNRYTFLTLDSALALDEILAHYPDKTASVLIIGAGLIGLKCAEGIIGRVHNITFVDMADRVLPSILDAEAASIIQKSCENEGLQFILGDSVAEFTASERGGGHAVTKNGVALDFDILVLAVGVRPNTSLIKDAGGVVNRGIAVNNRMMTSLPDVYAAGDSTEAINAVTGDNMIMAIMPNAYMQGETAGFNMAGAPVEYSKLIPCNAIGFFGKRILSGGSYFGDEYFTNNESSYRKLFYSDNRLNGFILIGPEHPGEGEIPAYDKAGIYTNLIRERTPIDSLLFEEIIKEPGLYAFGKPTRREYLSEER